MIRDVFRAEFTVRSYEMDHTGHAPLTALCRYLQEAADCHARALGVSVEALLADGMTWVLSRLHVSIDRFPMWRDTFRIDTWPSGRTDHVAFRDFMLVDSDNRPIGRATSCWMMLDLKTRRSIPLPPSVQKLPVPDRSRAIDDPFDRLPSPDRIEREVNRTAGWKEIDLNRHVNNVTYVDWALDAVPDSLWRSHRPHGIEIAYKNEIRQGDTVVSLIQTREALEDRSVFLHGLTRQGIEVAVARSVWMPIRRTDAASA